MGLGDKISNKAQETAGKAKEKLAEGTEDQVEAKAKQAGEHLKDAAKDVTGQ